MSPVYTHNILGGIRFWVVQLKAATDYEAPPLQSEGGWVGVSYVWRLENLSRSPLRSGFSNIDPQSSIRNHKSTIL
jgi:hypothetical protein